MRVVTVLLLTGCGGVVGTVDSGGVPAGSESDVGATTVDCTVPASALTPSQVSIVVSGGKRRFTANGMPGHDVGAFPNAHNPNRISTQSYAFEVPVTPGGPGADLGMQSYGVGLNGVPIDPFAAEWWQNDPQSGWQYEPLSGAIDLGVDCNLAHPQPTGAYHYHGVPEGLIEALDTGEGMVQVAWAADGHPIYARWGFTDPDDPESTVVTLRSSYRLRSGTRPGGAAGPGGTYDGTFVEDWEYVDGVGDLDECNGRTGWTAELGTTYYYVLTDTFPFVPRCWVNAPDPSFEGPPPRWGAPRGPAR